MKNKQLLNKVENWFKEIEDLKSLNNIKIKHSFDTKDKIVIFSFAIINKKTAWTRGTSNKTKDFMFVPYFDWDKLRGSYVKEQALILQEQFDLGDLMIFESSKGSYQGVGFVKLTLHELQECLMHSSCDYAFIQFPKFLPYAKYYVLRQFEKGKTSRPKYLYTLKRKTKRQQSSAHWKYFNILYPKADIPKLTNPDGLLDITIVDYPTGSNV